MLVHAGVHLFERESLNILSLSTNRSSGLDSLDQASLDQAFVRLLSCPCKGRKLKYYLAFHLVLHSSRIKTSEGPLHGHTIPCSTGSRSLYSTLEVF
jgi:hypothetical protein